MKNSNPTICLTAPGKIELQDKPYAALNENEVLIETRCTLISTGTEMSLYSADEKTSTAWREFARLPRSMGYSHAGVVIEVGKNVKPEWLGKRVASRGCHAQFVVRDVSDLRLIPDEVSDEDAAFSVLAAVVMNGLRRGRLSWGEHVMVFGLGILGQLSVRLSAICGANSITAVDVSDVRLARLPAEAGFISGMNGENLEALRQEMAAKDIPISDFLIETTGEPELIPRQFAFLRDQGRFLMLSSPREKTLFDFHELCNRRSMEIIGAHGFSQPSVATVDYPWTGQKHGELFLQYLAQGRLSVNEMITHRYAYRDAGLAYSLLENDRANTLAIIFNWA